MDKVPENDETVVPLDNPTDDVVAVTREIPVEDPIDTETLLEV